MKANNDVIKQNILDIVYPIGSIYMSVNSASPATFLGGTWTQIQDTFLLSAGSTYTAGSTGGAATHRHLLPLFRHNAGGTATSTFGIVSEGSYYTGSVEIFNSGGPKINTISVAGTEKTGAVYEFMYKSMESSTMPPYLTVYMWKRTA